MDCSAILANADRMMADRDHEPDECASRAIIHAAYYSVYHLCSQLLGLPTTGMQVSVHAAVTKKLDEYKGVDRGLLKAKRSYKSLKALRVKADYDLTVRVIADEAEEALSYAQGIFAAATKVAVCI